MKAMVHEVATLRCPVCSQETGRGNTVHCAACNAPHHRDCFEYNGRCAIFGCGQGRYLAGATSIRTALVCLEESGGCHRLSLIAHTRLRGTGRILTAGGIGGLGLFALLALNGMLPIFLAVPLLSSLVVAGCLSGVSLGLIVRHADSSEWVLDPGRGDVHLIARLLGVVLFQRKVLLSRIRSLDLFEPAGPGGGSMWLTLLTREGDRLWLASGDGTFGREYNEADLVRIGNRWAAVLQVPFTHSFPKTTVPELPDDR